MEIVYKDVDERFDNATYKKYAISTVMSKINVLQERFKNLLIVNFILEISFIGDNKTLNCQKSYFINENEKVLNLRLTFLGYNDNEKPDTLEFTRRINEIIDVAF